MATRYISLIAASGAALAAILYVIRQLRILARLVIFAGDLPAKLQQLSTATAANTVAIQQLNQRLDAQAMRDRRRRPT